MIKIGLCITGSFCTLSSVLKAIDDLIAADYDITPIFSYTVSQFDTRFFKQADFERVIIEKCGKTPIKTIVDAEKIGAKSGLKAMVVAPCTGNTLSKLANGITDTPVTMSVKACLRNNLPIVVSISTNDGLGANAQNIGKLLNTRNFYFVPFYQDDAINKPKSLVADTTKIVKALGCALKGEVYQPIIIQKPV